MDISESRSELALDAALRVLAPLVEWLLQEGVTYPRLAAALKQSFLDAAPTVLGAGATKVNDSSVSVLTGIHRKDVRAWRCVGTPLPRARTFGAVMEIFTRWASDPAYRDAKGRPRKLDLAGSSASFEALATSVCNDVHPHTLLREMVRLGIANRSDAASAGESDKVSLCAQALVPEKGTAEMLQIFADNVADHLAAATHNLSRRGDAMLEQSVFADGLRPESVAAMGALTRQLWLRAFQDIVREASVKSDADRGQRGADQRVRIGMYFYHGANASPPA